MQMSYELAFMKTVGQFDWHNHFQFLDQVSLYEQKSNNLENIRVAAIPVYHLQHS